MASVLLLTAYPPIRLSAQFIQPEHRALLSDFSTVTAVAATHALVYVATPSALVVYDRATLRWRETVGPQGGFPPGGADAMAADPNDGTVWLAGAGQWYAYRPFARSWESGPLPGRAGPVVLDRDDPSRGAYFQTGTGWYFVDRGGFGAAAAPPPAGRRLGTLSREELRRVAPAWESVLPRVTRDDQLRAFELTAASASPLGEAIYLATAGNGAFRLDPIGYSTDRLPAGLLAPGAGSLAVTDGRVCVGTDHTAGLPYARPWIRRRGVTCVREDFGADAAWEARGMTTVGDRVRALAPAADGAVWAASEQGLARLGPGRQASLTVAQGLPSSDVRSLAPERGGVWVGTSHGVAFVTDGERPAVAAAVAFGAAVGALLVHRDTLWIGSSRGLVVLPRGALEPLAVQGGPALRLPVVDLAVRGDTLVCATEGRVLWRVGGQWSDAGAGIPDVGRIAALAAGAAGLWVAGEGGIAQLTRGGAWVALGSPRDLPLPVRNIAVDARFVWLATPLGVVRLDARAVAR